MELTAQQNEQIQQAFKHLPEGFEIVSSEQLQTLKGQKNSQGEVIKELTARILLLEFVFKKLKPIFSTFSGGGGDLMSALPQLMPAITQLQTDEELKTKMAEVIASI